MMEVLLEVESKAAIIFISCPEGIFWGLWDKFLKKVMIMSMSAFP